MSNYTPTTEQVRDAYVRASRNAFIASASEHEAEFDRWLKLEQHTARQQGYAERLHDEAAGIGADIDGWTSPAHHTLATVRAEYARYQQHGDLHELARAIGQVLGEQDEWLDPPVPIERPHEEDNA